MNILIKTSSKVKDHLGYFSAQKEKINPPWKNVLFFSKKKKKILMFHEMKLSGPEVKKLQYWTSQVQKINKKHSEKFLFISGKGTF